MPKPHSGAGRVPCRSLSVLLILSSLLAAAPAVAADPDDDETSWEKISHQWFEEVEPGGTIRVENPWGRIYARFGGYEPKAEILATEQRLDKDVPRLTVDRLRSGDELHVVVRASNRPEGTSGARGERRDRIDLVVFVPEGISLTARTDSDLIAVKGVRGDVRLTSVRGDIDVRKVQGAVNASTARGDIYVAFENATDQTQELTTETGDIEAQLWEDAARSVSLATSGEISTDFSLTIEHRRFEEPGKIARATVGGGGPQLSLYSKRGHLKLMRMQKFFTPDE